MAGIKQPLQDILARLATLDVVNQDGQTVKLFTRVWNNQVEFEKQGALQSYPKPAAFVEILAPVVFDEIGQNFRSADLGINIHLVHENMNTEGTFEQDLLIFDLRDQVIALLSQYKPTACGQLVATGESPDYEHDNVYHYVISFVCNFIDSTASPYAPGRGIYVEKEPPTDLEVITTKANTPINTPVIQQYNIPQ